MKKLLQSLVFVIFSILLLPGLALSQIDITPSVFDFPPQQITTTSKPNVFTVTNHSDGPLTLHPEQISITGKDAQSTEISVLSYNIETDDGDWPGRFAYILDEIRDKEIDVIGLQEVIQRSNLDNQAMQMADSLGYYYYFDSVDDERSVQRFGNAIVSRYPIKETHFRALEPLNQYRKALHAKLDINGHTVDFYVTHLHHKMLDHDIRKEQIRDLIDFIEVTRSGDTYFLTGDFNANPDWEEMELIYEHINDVYPLFHTNHLDPEHTTLNPRMGHQMRRIDYVFFQNRGSNNLRALSAEIILDKVHQRSQMESDHFGVLARFEIMGDEDDFILKNIQDSTTLQPDESATVEVVFAPITVGLKEISVNILDQQATVRGEAFDATIEQLPWSESFSDVDESKLPYGWHSEADNWSVLNSTYAEGEAPELVFGREPVIDGRFHVRTPPLRTTGMDSLVVSFRHSLKNFENPASYDLKLVSLAGEEEFVIRQWSNPGDMEAAELSTVISSEEHGVGASRLYLAWVFEGVSDQILRWSIDDVRLEALPALQVYPDRHDFGEHQVHTTSDSVAFTIANIGSGTIILEPDDLQITGEFADQFVLHEITESISLQGETISEVIVSFSPSQAGDFQAILNIGDRSLPLFGRSFDPSITELPWQEDFSALVQGGIPKGWESDTRNWEAFNLNNAGGNPPEMVFWWEPQKEGRFYLKTPNIETLGYEELTLTYRYRVRNFGDPGKYTLSVIAIADGEEYVIEEWVDPAFIGQSEFSGTITREDHGLGSDEFRLAWVFDGTTNNMTSWDIDDIRLSDESLGTNVEGGEELPLSYGLDQNYPNPFNPTTSIRYQLPQSAHVTLKIYDVSGRLIVTLVDEQRSAGRHTARFDASNLASGLYLYRMQAGEFMQTRKLMLIK